ncbi:MAG: NYN domain-containing protein [Acidimicrobiales bacterium]
MLRPALQAAVSVARAGEEALPVRPAPPALRPFLQFAKLPPRALVAARRALDADEELRTQVADAVSEDEVGTPGWLFLTRPEGWQDDLANLARQAADERAEVAARRADSVARRRADAAEGATRRAEEAVAAARAEATRATEVLSEERRARREAARRTAEPPMVPATARPVRVMFSPPGVEADDVILDEVAGVDPQRPVVVVSSDRRVRDGARARGANVLRSSQLLDLLRR